MPFLEGGSDWRKVIIMDAISKKIIEDTLLTATLVGLSWRGK
jgi:prolyl oligopeptidase